MKRGIQRRFFTLVELFVSLSLIVLLGSIICLRARTMIDRYRFTIGAKRLVEELNLTRELALVSDNDIDFQLERKRSKLIGVRKVDAKLHFPRTFGVKLTFIPITHLYWNEQEVEELALHFMATGWLFEEGILYLSYKGQYQCFIDLHSFPFTLSFSEK